MSKIYDDENVDDMTDKQKRLVKAVEELGKKLLGDDFDDFKKFMDQNAVVIEASRSRMSITFKEVSEKEVLDIILPEILTHILNFYEQEDRLKVILKAVSKCKDGKEKLCEEED